MMETGPDPINRSGESGLAVSVVQELGGGRALGWEEIAKRVSKSMEQPPPQGVSPGHFGRGGVGQLSELLRLQMEVAQYQLRVELIAKVSESAVASLRKLQQTP